MGYLERVFRASEEENRQVILQTLEPRPGGVLLDLGCSDGEVTDQTDFSWDGPLLAEQATTVRAGAAVRHQVVSWDYRPGTVVTLTPKPTAEAGAFVGWSPFECEGLFQCTLTLDHAFRLELFEHRRFGHAATDDERGDGDETG